MLIHQAPETTRTGASSAGTELPPPPDNDDVSQAPTMRDFAVSLRCPEVHLSALDQALARFRSAVQARADSSQTH